MYQLENSTYLYALALLPVLALVYIWVLWWRKRAQARFASPELLARLAPDRSKFKSHIKVLAVLLGILALILALVNPRIGTKTQSIEREGLDLILVMDVSKSMLAEDIAPNRMEKAKQIAQQIVNNSEGNRVGIIGYAGSAFPYVPLTSDLNTVKLFINNMHTDMVSSEGTGIAEAISMANRFYSFEADANRLVVLLSDGEDHEGGLEEVIQESIANGVHIVSVGLGTERGAPIPITTRGQMQYLRDWDDNQVITKMDVATLSQLSEQTNGLFLLGDQTREVVREVINFSDGMDKSSYTSEEFSEYYNYFQWLIGIGFAILVLDMLFLERKTNWLRKLNLFNEEKDE